MAVDAQCALVCSFQAIQPIKQEAHACCKEHKSSAGHKPVRCPELYLTTAPQKSQTALCFIVEPRYAMHSDTALSFYMPPQSAGLHAIPDIPSFAVLRI
jgi:hypothetical protein